MSSTHYLPQALSALVCFTLFACGGEDQAGESSSGGTAGAATGGQAGNGGSAGGAGLGGVSGFGGSSGNAGSAGAGGSLPSSCGDPTSPQKLTLLSVSAANPRYLENEAGVAQLLTGQHIWNNLQVEGLHYDPYHVSDLDYCAYVDHMQANGQNFMRLWSWQNSAWESGERVEPMPFKRVSGTAADGGKKFDLTAFNQKYFDRMRDRIIDAGKRGIYVDIMLFQGWSGHRKSPAPQKQTWKYNLFNSLNNVNGIDGDTNKDGFGVEAQTLDHPEIVAIQKAYVTKVIDTVNDLDNVLYEIVNEGDPTTKNLDWQKSLIDFVKQVESKKPKQHPVGFTNQMAPQLNATLLNSKADWVSLGGDNNTDWPDADGKKVVILDTDHISPAYFGDKLAFQRQWSWKLFTRGYSFVFMLLSVDAATNAGNGFNALGFSGADAATARTRTWAAKFELNKFLPRSDLASTGYCLARAGAEYLVYAPNGGSFTLEIGSANTGSYTREWYNPRNGKTNSSKQVQLDQGSPTFTAPSTADWVLYLKRT